jgi:predicted DNA-binding transcriptional regulator
MTQELSSKLDHYIKSAGVAGLSGKASSVYVILLDAGKALSPKAIITKTHLHRQYVYDAIHELLDRRLISPIGSKKMIKYAATSPDKILQEVEMKRIQALDSVQTLMKLYNKSPEGLIEVISGSQAVIESELKLLEEESCEGDYLDIIGGAGMHFVRLFEGRIEEYEKLRAEKKIKLRYIGSGEDVEHNKLQSIKNESKKIEGIKDIVNICIRPQSVSFQIYVPEVLTVRVRNEAAVASQRALFEVLWNIAK